MRYLKIATILVFLISVGAYILTEYGLKNEKDTMPPVITADSDTLELSVSDPKEALLLGLSASDDVDGDITDRILISGESFFLSPGECSVRYVVFDSAHNSATYKRTIRYTDYTSPHFELHEPLNYVVGGQVRFMEPITAYDCIDGDITGKIRIVSSSVSNYMEGVYPAKLEVMNSHGDKTNVDVNVLITQNAFTPSITLKEYITYVKKGDVFDPYSLIQDARDEDGRQISKHDVKINGVVNTQTEGNYTLFYSLSSNDSLKGAYLTVVVEEVQS